MTALGLALPLTVRRRTQAQLLSEVAAEVVAADRAGFDVCLVPEHHQGPEIGLGAPLTMVGWLAAMTERIRLGTGVLVLPSHHPVHVAEQVAMLDQLSGGRLVLGVGAGYQDGDLAPFGASLESRVGRLAESLAVLDEALRTGRIDHEGEHYTVRGVTVSPRPVQQPRPPIWLGSWSPRGVRRAATAADGWIADPIRTTTEVATMADRYREALGGRDGTVVVMREAWVDADDRTAAERFAPVIERVMGYYRTHGALQDEAHDFASLAEDRLLFGSAATVRDEIDDVAVRTGADVVVLTLRQPGGPEHEQVVEAIDGLGATAGAWR